jgi:beta-hydroxyacyl-ACP dehydratase FabZ
MTTLLDATEIQKFLPHRYPFLLVDKIIELERGKRVVGIKNVSINEWFFQGHFPGRPIMPGVLIIEAMAQVGAVLLLQDIQDEDLLIYFMSMDNVKFRKPVLPGDQIRFELEVINLRKRSARMQGRAYVEDKLVAEAILTSMVADR